MVNRRFCTADWKFSSSKGELNIRMKFLAIVCIVMLCARTAMAGTCYVCVGCNSVTDSNLVDCGALFDKCVTVVFNGVVSRSCSSSVTTVNGVSVSGTSDGCTQILSAQYCVCTGDGCNRSTYGGSDGDGSTRANAGVLLSLILSGIASYFLL